MSEQLDVYDYRLYRTSELKQLQDDCQLKLRRWLEDWAIQPEAEAIVVVGTHLPNTKGKWLIDETAGMALDQSQPYVSFMAKACFNQALGSATPNQTTICQNVLTKALQNCLSTVLHIEHMPTEKHDTLPKGFNHVGCVQLTITIAGKSLTLILSSKKVAQLLGKAAVEVKPLPNVTLAKLPLAGQTQLNVWFNTTTIAWDELSHMQLGDVIKLDHRINQPMQLHNSAKQPIGIALPQIHDGLLQVCVGNEH